MSAETPSPQQSQPDHPKEATPKPGEPAIHRVCIQCNAMFLVRPENFDAKQCPNCHKG